LDNHFRLRLGADVLDIIDTSFDPRGRPTGTGTISPGVERDLIKATPP
jgi:type IV secretory pathway VirB9-like protein